VREQVEGRDASTSKAGGLARLSLLLLVSTLGIAASWKLLYGVGFVTALAVVGEIAVILVLAFVCAWRWSQ
jgi:hypothetical protein